MRQRSATAIAGLHWNGDVIALISTIEAPAVAHGIPVLHDYFGFNKQPPHNAVINGPDNNFWGVNELYPDMQTKSSFLVEASIGDVPADLPWLFDKVASLNADAEFSSIKPIQNLIVLAETMKGMWSPEGLDEKRNIACLKEARVRTVFLVRVDANHANSLAAGKAYAAFRRVAKKLGGVCAPFRRENVLELATVAGYHVAGLLEKLNRDDVTTDAGKKFLADCLGQSCPR
ncbi:MAG: hypothetical protein PHD48_03360 [Alphaproteobacteria bacterium]|nr:hypothetical protein [Alphaproteobacteria bacterium]